MAARKRIEAKAINSFNSYFEDFISEKKALNKSDATLRNYADSWRRYQQLCQIDSITESDIYKYINALRDTGMTSHSINHYLRDLRTFLNWCINKGYLETFTVHLVEEEEIVQATYQDKEILTLIQKPNKNDSFVVWRSWCMLNLFFSGGMRASSACALRMKDIDFDSNLIILTRTKNKKIIGLPIGRELIIALKLYIRMFRADATDDDYVFPSVYGGVLSVNAMKLAIIDYNTRRGIGIKGTKAARHTFSKAWVKSGGDLYRLQKVLGHKSPKMTQHYADIWGKDLQEGFEQHNLLDRVKAENSRKHAITRK